MSLYRYVPSPQRNLPVARDKVDDLVREAAVPLAAADEPELMLAVRVSPGSLDAGFGNAVEPGAAMREGGLRPEDPTTLEMGLGMEVVRAAPEDTLVEPAVEVVDRRPPMGALGTAGAILSFAAKLGR